MRQRCRLYARSTYEKSRHGPTQKYPLTWRGVLIELVEEFEGESVVYRNLLDVGPILHHEFLYHFEQIQLSAAQLLASYTPAASA